MNLQEKIMSFSCADEAVNCNSGNSSPPLLPGFRSRIFYFFIRNHFTNLARLYKVLNGNEKNSCNSIDGVVFEHCHLGPEKTD